VSGCQRNEKGSGRGAEGARTAENKFEIAEKQQREGEISENRIET